MANLDTANFVRVTDKRAGTGFTSTPFATKANYTDIADMRARLTAISGTIYTAARLDQMTQNDMVYAIRLNDDAAGIN
jgi:hypothetical protein